VGILSQWVGILQVVGNLQRWAADNLPVPEPHQNDAAPQHWLWQ
jgi:hypothetical protein